MLFRNAAWSIALLLYLGPSALPQAVSPQATSASVPYNDFGPVTDYAIALKDSSDSSHSIKGMRYNLNGSHVAELGESSQPALFELPHSHTAKSISSAGCDTIIVGIISGGQSYLSNDRRNIYSEFKVRLQEVLRSSVTPLSSGQSIDIERSGGAIRLPSGKILQRGSIAESMPRVGGKYVFLLRYKQDTNSFILKTGFQLEGDHVYRLDDEKAAAENLSHPLKEHGGTETQLIEHLKNLI